MFATAPVIIHRGFSVLNRSKYTTTEREFISFSQFSLKGLKHGFLDLPARARRRLLTCASPSPLMFCLTLFTLYTLQCMVSIKDYSIFKTISGVRGIALILCVILLSEWSWPRRWQQYYALYWLFTLFFCVPFTETFLFFHAHEKIFATMHWVGMFIFLACLVDSSLFIRLGIAGIVGATTVSYCLGRGLASVDS